MNSNSFDFRLFLVSLGIILLLIQNSFGGVPRKGKFSTPLDDYVHAPDPTYSWKLNSTFYGFGYTAYNIDLISQTWLTPNDSDSSIWRHWVTICVPYEIKHNTAFMYIDGGHTYAPAPTSVDLLTEVICLEARTVSAALLTIPNEPIVFKAEGKERSEDGLIAYTWSHFLNETTQPNWLLRLPMTKAAVKAMDCIQEFVQTLKGVPPVNNFVVAGASKRGWTTWTTGAVDQRVIAMVPMVMPILNIVPNMNHHYRAYGGWSFALDDYLDMGLMKYLNDPVFVQLANIVDPWTYRNRLTMPKLIITGVEDEFFLPDSPQFFMDGLPKEKLLCVIPDAEHSLGTALIEVGANIGSFYKLILTKTPRPEYTYQIIRSNTTAKIIVNTTGIYSPYQVKMWYAYSINDTIRDFRLVVCDKLPDCFRPVLWISKLLEASSPGVYVAEMQAPSIGWIAFLVEITYKYDFPMFETAYLEVSSDVNIVPDTLPFPPCGNHCQD